MIIKRILLYFLLITFFQSYPQLNQQSKKITKKFFSDLNELEDVTPALKKKKGFTNYLELIEFIEEKTNTHACLKFN